MIGASNTRFQIKKDNRMKKVLMLIISLSIISSSSLFCGKDKAINPENLGEAKDMPIQGGKDMPINAKGVPIMGQQKERLEKIKELALKIKKTPRSRKNEQYAEQIMQHVDALL